MGSDNLSAACCRTHTPEEGPVVDKGPFGWAVAADSDRMTGTAAAAEVVAVA